MPANVTAHHSAANCAASEVRDLFRESLFGSNGMASTPADPFLSLHENIAGQFDQEVKGRSMTGHCESNERGGGLRVAPEVASTNGCCCHREPVSSYNDFSLYVP